ncbi:uncharacterized protein LOC134269185 [Saccostrea cucullata]|uniref:uncharacterized protein LOC134269185 n=1 Tax=Saccostrea cuccullata TaxID=36930 RepID=UPI002ECFE46D
MGDGISISTSQEMSTITETSLAVSTTGPSSTTAKESTTGTSIAASATTTTAATTNTTTTEATITATIAAATTTTTATTTATTAAAAATTATTAAATTTTRTAAATTATITKTAATTAAATTTKAAAAAKTAAATPTTTTATTAAITTATTTMTAATTAAATTTAAAAKTATATLTTTTATTAAITTATATKTAATTAAATTTTTAAATPATTTSTTAAITTATTAAAGTTTTTTAATVLQYAETIIDMIDVYDLCYKNSRHDIALVTTQGAHLYDNADSLTTGACKNMTIGELFPGYPTMPDVSTWAALLTYYNTYYDLFTHFDDRVFRWTQKSGDIVEYAGYPTTKSDYILQSLYYGATNIFSTVKWGVYRGHGAQELFFGESGKPAIWYYRNQPPHEGTFDKYDISGKDGNQKPINPWYNLPDNTVAITGQQDTNRYLVIDRELNVYFYDLPDPDDFNTNPPVCNLKGKLKL